MRSLFESDRQFYAIVGVATIAVFVVALVGIAAVGPSDLGTRELLGLVAGFAVFMFVFFISYAIRRLEDAENV